MGYDFMFEKAKDVSQVAFPCELGGFEIDTGFFPWNDLKNHLLTSGAVEQDFSSVGLDHISYRLEVDDRGSIDVSGTEDYASLDVHAEWIVILELFLWLRNRDLNIVLADTNEGLYHDPDSFRDLIAEIKRA